MSDDLPQSRCLGCCCFCLFSLCICCLFLFSLMLPQLHNTQHLQFQKLITDLNGLRCQMITNKNKLGGLLRTNCCLCLSLCVYNTLLQSPKLRSAAGHPNTCVSSCYDKMKRSWQHLRWLQEASSAHVVELETVNLSLDSIASTGILSASHRKFKHSIYFSGKILTN